VGWGKGHPLPYFYHAHYGIAKIKERHNYYSGAGHVKPEYSATYERFHN
jgi:hypothetical protein